MPQPESGLWYVEPLQAVAEELLVSGRSEPGAFIVEAEGGVAFRGSVRFDNLIEGGYENLVDHFAQFTEVRRRLGLHADIDSVSKTDLGPFRSESWDSFRINFSKWDGISDNEAMFLIALPLSKAERPMEKVFAELRTCARLGITQAMVDSLAKPAPKETIRTMVNFELIESRDRNDLAEMMSGSRAIQSLALDFATYKRLMVDIRTATDKKPIIKQLGDLERGFGPAVFLANNGMDSSARREVSRGNSWVDGYRWLNLSSYEIAFGLAVGDPRDPRFMRGFPIVPFSEVPNGMKIPERERLDLVIMPQSYSARRSRLMGQKSVRQTEDAG